MTKAIKFKINKPSPLIKDNWLTAQDIINSHERGFKEGVKEERKRIIDKIDGFFRLDGYYNWGISKKEWEELKKELSK